MERIPGANTCQGCHWNAVTLAGSSLHVKPSGFVAVLEGRGFDFGPGTASLERFTKQCTKCHIHNAESPEQPACGHCHVSVPNSAGGGLIAGHRMNKVPDTANNCTACHGSRVKDEYFGQNQALYVRNRTYNAAFAAADPFAGAALQPDVHKAGGMGCDACHYKAELHGAGAMVGIDRYGITGRTQCVSCHGQLASNGFHSAKHVETMSCHVCHSQPYKQCFGCHTQERDGAPFFVTNEDDPTRAARTAPPSWSAATTYAKDVFVTYASVTYKSLQASNTNHLPDEPASVWWVAATPKTVAGDALITFRVGNNPRFGELGAPKYAVLRHVPIDGDTFKYTLEGVPVEGLVPNLTGLPTWKYATPHNIQRVTRITTDPDGAGPATACGNCHSARYSSFWLTDAINDTFGWAPSGAAWESTANADVVQLAPIAPALP